VKSISHHPLSKQKRPLSPALFTLILGFALFLLVFFCYTGAAYASEVSLIWDPVIHPDLAGYKMFCREESKTYNYGNPAWVGTETSCTVDQLNEHANYCFVVRAFDTSGNESDDSNEVCSSPAPDYKNPPSKPHIISPYDGQMECDLLATVEAGVFSDPDGDAHNESRWQIVKTGDSSMVLDISSNKHLTELPVPHTVLDRGTSYAARVQFYDNYHEASEWSEYIEFTTALDMVDLDGDGIPDDKEVDDTVDLNDDSIPDNDQPELIKSVQSTTGGNVAVGVCKDSATVEEIEVLEPIHPATIWDKKNRPMNFEYGLFSYRVKVSRAGDLARVKLYYSEDISHTAYFYIYDRVNGWRDYTQYATFNPDGRSVTLELKDGGHGDSDGVENGIIVDPSGVTSSIAGLDAGVGGGCFIATATSGFYFDPQVILSRDFRGEYLLGKTPRKWLVKQHHRYWPHAAEYIQKHEWLKPVVPHALMPQVGFSYLLLKGVLVLSLPFVLGLIMLVLFHLFKQHPAT
jgi:hypothetical protein